MGFLPTLATSSRCSSIDSRIQVLADLEAVGQDLLGDPGGARLVVLPRVLGAAGLDHHDGDLGPGLLRQGPPGHDELEARGVTFLVGGVRDPRPLGRPCHADRADGAVEGDPRQHQRGRGRVDGEDVVGVDLVGRQDRPHHVDLVAEPLGERRPQGTVDQSVGQDGLVGGPSFPAEERPGDLAGRVHPLLDVHGQGEEVGPLPHASRRGGGDEDHGVADAAQDGAVGLAGRACPPRMKVCGRSR